MNPQVEKASTIIGTIVLGALSLLLLNYLFKQGYVQKFIDFIARSLESITNIIIKGLTWVLSTQQPKKEVAQGTSN